MRHLCSPIKNFITFFYLEESYIRLLMVAHTLFYGTASILSSSMFDMGSVKGMTLSVFLSDFIDFCFINWHVFQYYIIKLTFKRILISSVDHIASSYNVYSNFRYKKFAMFNGLWRWLVKKYQISPLDYTVMCAVPI